MVSNDVFDLSARVREVYNRPRTSSRVFLGSCRIHRRPLRLARSRVARGLRAFPFASDSTGWLSAPRKSVSIATRTAPDPRVRPGPIRVFRVPARERFRRKARGGRRETSLAGSAGARYRRTRRGGSCRSRLHRVESDSIPTRARDRVSRRPSPRADHAPPSRPRGAGSCLVSIARACRTLREPRR